MTRPEPTRIVSQLPDAIPFVAPEEFERQIGQKFLARIGANESVFGPSPEAIEAMIEAARNSQWYGDPLSFELKTALAIKHNLTVDNFVVGPGIDGLFGHIARAYFEAGDKVVTTLGSYPTFNYFVEVVGAELAQVPYRDFKADLDALALQAKHIRAKAVYLANPDNPAGTLHSGKDIKNFIRQVPDGTMIILDEAYLDFVEDYDVSDPRLIRLRTFSKLYGMAGARVGYAFGEPETVPPLNRIRPHFEVNLIAQVGAMASLADQEFKVRMQETNRLAKYDLAVLLEKFGLYPLESSTNFVLGDAGSTARAEAFVAGLRREGVFIRKPGSPPLDKYIRVTVGQNEDYVHLARALKQVNL